MSNGFDISMILKKVSNEEYILTYKFLDVVKNFTFENIASLTRKVANTLLEVLKEII